MAPREKISSTIAAFACEVADAACGSLGVRKLGSIFYGWKMAGACFGVAVCSWALGFFGSSVYLHSLSVTNGWPIGQVSSAISLSYFTSALCLGFVGTAIQRFGPRPIFSIGAILLGAGVVALGRATAPWHAYIDFGMIGLGWSCLSSVSISAALAPWFERHQGRAVSLALLGASVSGIIGVPSLLFAISELGFRSAMLAVGSAGTLAILLFGAFLRHRPEDYGLLPDGAAAAAGESLANARRWTRGEAFRTFQLWTVILAFGLALLVQIGFCTHQVEMLLPEMGAAGCAAVISSSAAASFAGRMILSRYADRINPRIIASFVFLFAATALMLLASSRSSAVLFFGCVAYGSTIGNTTTLGPIVVRREFGSVSFASVMGAAAVFMQTLSSAGPGLFGMGYEYSGGYGVPLFLAGLLDLVAAAAVAKGAVIWHPRLVTQK